MNLCGKIINFHLITSYLLNNKKFKSLHRKMLWFTNLQLFLHQG